MRDGQGKIVGFQSHAAATCFIRFQSCGLTRLTDEAIRVAVGLSLGLSLVSLRGTPLSM